MWPVSLEQWVSAWRITMDFVWTRNKSLICSGWLEARLSWWQTFYSFPILFSPQKPQFQPLTYTETGQVDTINSLFGGCACFLGFLPPFSSEREIVLCSYRWKTCHFPMLSCRKLLKKYTCFQNVCSNFDVRLNEIFVSWRLSKSFVNQGVVNSKRLVVVLNT